MGGGSEQNNAIDQLVKTKSDMIVHLVEMDKNLSKTNTEANIKERNSVFERITALADELKSFKPHYINRLVAMGYPESIFRPILTSTLCKLATLQLSEAEMVGSIIDHPSWAALCRDNPEEIDKLDSLLFCRLRYVFNCNV
jgi:hypothetical protein